MYQYRRERTASRSSAAMPDKLVTEHQPQNVLNNA
jgi:hypothetical protein